MSRPALLLAGHGTRDPAGVAAFGAFTARIAAALAPQGVDVAGGFIELSAPPLRDAVAELTGRGHRHLVAVPLVLSAASHSKSDIPAALARERARHPGLGWSYGRPLGPHPVLLELLAASNPSPARLGAVRTVLEYGLKLREAADLEERVAAVEDHIAAQLAPPPES